MFATSQNMAPMGLQKQRWSSQHLDHEDSFVDCGRHERPNVVVESQIQRALPTPQPWAPEQNESLLETRITKVRRLSALILVVATVTNLGFQGLPSMSELTSSSIGRPNLGSAAISSVTNAFSPVLPFTGGLDLRREDYWKTSGNWLQTVRSVVSQVQDAFSGQLTDLSSVNPASNQSVLTTRREVQYNEWKKAQRALSLSASQPFVKSALISQLTLKDMAEVFRFIMESGKPNFNSKRFRETVSEDVKRVLDAIVVATAQSRGANVLDAEIKEGGSLEIDALKFLAAMRIFAEWRVLRQVPEGFKGYEMGMTLGQKDVVQNVAKIEQAVHSWLDFQVDRHNEMSDKGGELRAPTLRQLLEYEVEMGVHPNLPRLKDRTAGMGLLWVRRQLQYQTRLFYNVVHVGSLFETTRDAVAASYAEVYDKYHGWAVQKIFNYSFQSAPEAEDIYRHMNPRKLSELEKLAAEGKFTTTTTISKEQPNAAPCAEPRKQPRKNKLHALLRRVVGLWKRIFPRRKRNDNQKKCESPSESASTLVDSTATTTTTTEVDSEAFMRREIIKDAHEHIAVYLDVVNPLLHGLDVLIQQMNMDDPTKV